ncbi:hypothetical protein Dimus_003638 [Dionaea muscipula]
MSNDDHRDPYSFDQIADTHKHRTHTAASRDRCYLVDRHQCRSLTAPLPPPLGRRFKRDDIEVEVENAEIPTENEEVNEGENQWRMLDGKPKMKKRSVLEDVFVETDVQVQGEENEEEAKTIGSWISSNNSFDSMDEVQATSEDVPAPAVIAASA